MTSIYFRDAFVQKELRLHFTLSGHCDRAGFAALWRRLHDYLHGSGLEHSMGLCLLVVRAQVRDIHPLERALLLAWLAQQPEVVLVRVQRATPDTKGGRDGKA